MKLEELLPQLHNKITYVISLNRGINIPILWITKTTNAKTIKLPITMSEVDLLSLVGQKTVLFGGMINCVIIDLKKIVENKHSYIKFNKHRKYEDWYIAQTKQGLVNVVKILFKKYKLPLSTYKHLITTIKNSG